MGNEHDYHNWLKRIFLKDSCLIIITIGAINIDGLTHVTIEVLTILVI